VTRRLRELLYRLRTEGDTPGRQAGAVALGVLIGCSPFYGLHLALCVVFARLLRLGPRDLVPGPDDARTIAGFARLAGQRLRGG